VGDGVEAGLVEDLDGSTHGALIDEHGAENGLLHLHSLGRQSVEAAIAVSSLRRHGIMIHSQL
jgi:hypothetical protein